MPLCGFNKEMLDGLRMFHKGLIEHGLILRSKKKNEEISQTIKNEILDMKRFLDEINKIEDPEIRMLIKTLTEYAKAFYLLAEKINLKEYQEVIEKINDLYWEMDNKFYTELEGQKDDMKKLAEHMDTVSKKQFKGVKA